MTTINKDNFFKNTYGVFRSLSNFSIYGDPDFVSESGSKYWYLDHGLIRQSDHWGSVSSCFWKLNGSKGGLEFGYIYWNSFKQIITLKAPNVDECLDSFECFKKYRFLEFGEVFTDEIIRILTNDDKIEYRMSKHLNHTQMDYVTVII